jgi:protein phosphatase
MRITIPKLSLLLLIGASSCGKSSFAKKHFLPTEIVSSDYCRALVSDDENDQSVTREAFEVLHLITAKRLALGRLTVIDATNVQPEARRPLLALALEYDVIPIAILLNLPEQICQERLKARLDRNFEAAVISQQMEHMQRSLPNLKSEGFNFIYELKTVEEIESTVIEREPIWKYLKQEK